MRRWDFRLRLNRIGGGRVDVTSSVVAGATGTLIQAADVDRDGRLDLITTDANGVTLARSLKAMEFGRLANLSVRTRAGAGDATLIASFILGGADEPPAAAAIASAARLGSRRRTLRDRPTARPCHLPTLPT